MRLGKNFLLCYAIISFAIGIYWLQQQRSLPQLSKLIGLISLLTLAWVCLQAVSLRLKHPSCVLRKYDGWVDYVVSFLPGRLRNKGTTNFFILLKIFLLLLWIFCLGITWATWRAQLRLQDRLLVNLENKVHTIQGTIADIPIPLMSKENARNGWRFLFEPDLCTQTKTLAITDAKNNIEENLDKQNKQNTPEDQNCIVYPKLLLLNWYGAIDKLKPGQRWQMAVTLKRPHGLSNPGGSDYEAWLFQRGISATGTVRQGSYLYDSDDLRYVIDRWRTSLITHIHTALPANHKYLGIIQALAIGEQYAVTQKDWERFRYTGTSHLLAISGLHITMIAGLVAFLSSWCWRRSTRLILLIPAPTVGLLLGFVAACIYGLLSGLHIPAQRALIMLTVIVLMHLSGRLTSPFVILSWALLVVLLVDPWAVLSPGFWLSFVAVMTILFALQRRGNDQVLLAKMSSQSRPTYWQLLKTKFIQASHIQLAISVMLVPLTALFFGQISLVSPIANALAIPIFSFLIVPLVLLGMLFPVSLAQWLFALAHGLIEWISYFLDWFASWTYASLTIFSPPHWAWLLSLLGAFWFIYARRWRIVGLPLLFFLLWRETSHTPLHGQVCVTVLDVGQGGAVFVRTANHTLLFDSGPAYMSGSDAAARVVLPYLRTRGINSLDKLIVSHQDADHSGGMKTLLKHLVVKQLSSSIPNQHPIMQSKEVMAIPHLTCQAGQAWEWDGVRFSIVHPLPGAQGKPNALSCTLQIATAHHTLLLPGDIESAQEQSIIARMPSEALRATVLLMPHHGSKTSSSIEWLDAIQPKIAIAQVGYLNRFHHPRPEILLRYTQRNVKVLRSDYHGAIELQTNGHHLEWQSWREQSRRYWHWKQD